MTDIQGAIGSKQMDRADDIVAERRRLASVYDEALPILIGCKPFEPEGYRHGYQSYPCLFQPQKWPKAILMVSIKPVMPGWRICKGWNFYRPATHAVHMLSFYAEKYVLKPADFPNAHAANNCSISLPLFHGMTADEQTYVVEKVKN